MFVFSYWSLDYGRRRYGIDGIHYRTKKIKLVKLERELDGHPERRIRCPRNPSVLDYCQRHYLVTWDSSTGLFQDFTPQPFAKGKHYDVTFATHTSYEYVICDHLEFNVWIEFTWLWSSGKGMNCACQFYEIVLFQSLSIFSGLRFIVWKCFSLVWTLPNWPLFSTSLMIVMNSVLAITVSTKRYDWYAGSDDCRMQTVKSFAYRTFPVFIPSIIFVI